METYIIFSCPPTYHESKEQQPARRRWSAVGPRARMTRSLVRATARPRRGHAPSRSACSANRVVIASAHSVCFRLVRSVMGTLCYPRVTRTNRLRRGAPTESPPPVHSSFVACCRYRSRFYQKTTTQSASGRPCAYRPFWLVHGSSTLRATTNCGMDGLSKDTAGTPPARTD